MGKAKLIMEVVSTSKKYVIESFPISIGRMPNNKIQIPDQFISRAHCSIYMQNGSIYLIDLKSTNGTFINGNLIKSAYEIKNDCLLRLGNTDIKIQLMK